jgi:hypothetical protein
MTSYPLPRDQTGFIILKTLLITRFLCQVSSTREKFGNYLSRAVPASEVFDFAARWGWEKIPFSGKRVPVKSNFQSLKRDLGR